MWLPFSCPLDHVLRIEALDDAPSEHGWALPIREGGYTASPRVPAAVKVPPRRRPFGCWHSSWLCPLQTAAPPRMARPGALACHSSLLCGRLTRCKAIKVQPCMRGTALLRPRGTCAALAGAGC